MLKPIRGEHVWVAANQRLVLLHKHHNLLNTILYIWMTLACAVLTVDDKRAASMCSRGYINRRVSWRRIGCISLAHVRPRVTLCYISYLQIPSGGSKL